MVNGPKVNDSGGDGRLLGGCPHNALKAIEDYETAHCVQLSRKQLFWRDQWIAQYWLRMPFVWRPFGKFGHN